MYKHILIPTDGSELATKAITAGTELAKTLGAKVTILVSTEPFQVFSLAPELVEYTAETYGAHAERQAKKILDAASQIAEAAGVPFDTAHIEHDHPYEAIIHTARNRHCDLIMMASHGRRGMSALVLGSETVKVLTHSRVPVLVYR